MKCGFYFARFGVGGCVTLRIPVVVSIYILRIREARFELNHTVISVRLPAERRQK